MHNMTSLQKGYTEVYASGGDGVLMLFREPSVEVPMYQFGVAKGGPQLFTRPAGCISVAAYRPRALIGGLLHLVPDPMEGVLPPTNEAEQLRNLQAAERYLDEFLETTDVAMSSRLAVIAGSADVGNPVIDEKEQKECLDAEMIDEEGMYYIRLIQHVVRHILSKGFRPEFYMNNSEKIVQLSTGAGLLTVTNDSVNSAKDKPAFVFDMKGRRKKMLTELGYLLEIAF